MCYTAPRLLIFSSPDAPQYPSPPERRMNYSVLKKAHKERKIPELNEADLEEKFVRGMSISMSSAGRPLDIVQVAGP